MRQTARLVAVMVALSVTGVLAADWPWVYGPARNGTSDQKGLLRTWPQDGPKVLWTAPVGLGFGGAAVSAGNVYVLDRDEKVGDKLRVFDLASGKELWSFAYDAPGAFMFAGSRTTPTVDGNLVYTSGPLGDLYAIDTKTHKPVWHKNIWKDFGGGELPRWAIVQHPLIYGNLLIVAPQTAQAGVVAYDKLTGELKWKSPALSGLPGYVSPMIIKIGGADHVVMTMASVGRGRTAKDGSVNGLDPADGKVLWSYMGWQCGIPVPQPVDAGDGRILITGGYGAGSAMFQVKKQRRRHVRRDRAVQEPRLRRAHPAAASVQGPLLLPLHGQRAQRRPGGDEHGRPDQVEDRPAAGVRAWRFDSGRRPAVDDGRQHEAVSHRARSVRVQANRQRGDPRAGRQLGAAGAGRWQAARARAEAVEGPAGRPIDRGAASPPPVVRAECGSIRTRLFPALIAAVVLTGHTTLPQSAAQSSSESSASGFTAHTIASGLSGGYQVVVADLNRDDKPDVIAVASGLTELRWYENPGWESHVLVGALSQPINAAAYDVDGDDIPEIALAHGFSNVYANSLGNVSILTHQGDPTRPWSIKEIDRVPTSHRLRFADVEGTGRKLLVNFPLIGPRARVPEYRDHVSLLMYRPGEWKREVISDREEGVVHGVLSTAWNDGRRDSLLSASFLGVHLLQFDKGLWKRTLVTRGDPGDWPKSGSSDVIVGHLGRERFVATIEPWHGNKIVIYRQQMGAWTRRVIDESIADGHTIVVGDFDGDARDEVVGRRETGHAQRPCVSRDKYQGRHLVEAVSGRWGYGGRGMRGGGSEQRQAPRHRVHRHGDREHQVVRESK